MAIAADSKRTRPTWIPTPISAPQSLFYADVELDADPDLDAAAINSRPLSSIRRRDRPAWQRKESLHYEACKEKRDGFLRRRGRGLIDSASILAAKTHEEIILVIGGQGFVFDDQGYRIAISKDASLAKVGRRRYSSCIVVV